MSLISIVRDRFAAGKRADYYWQALKNLPGNSNALRLEPDGPNGAGYTQLTVDALIILMHRHPEDVALQNHGTSFVLLRRRSLRNTICEALVDECLADGTFVTRDQLRNGELPIIACRIGTND